MRWREKYILSGKVLKTNLVTSPPLHRHHPRDSGNNCWRPGQQLSLSRICLSDPGLPSSGKDSRPALSGMTDGWDMSSRCSAVPSSLPRCGHFQHLRSDQKRQAMILNHSLRHVANPGAARGECHLKQGAPTCLLSLNPHKAIMGANVCPIFLLLEMPGALVQVLIWDEGRGRGL